MKQLQHPYVRPLSAQWSAASPSARVTTRRAIAAVVVLALMAGAYIAGTRRPHVYEYTASAFSSEGTIVTEEVGGRQYVIPTDVRWQGRDGAWRFGGRPECLPASGIGLEGPVRFGVVHPAGEGHVIWVSCRNASR